MMMSGAELSCCWGAMLYEPMAESSLYRQRLEVIAEKRRLQEEIRVARGELEEEKFRVERLKRKSLRERWLMDGAEGPEGPEDANLQDTQSAEGQAQARIRNLEDSLFTLQSQLQLLQSASTGAQHKPSGRPAWRRQSHRPLSQPTVEAGTTDQTDLNKRASLPAEPVDTSLESPSEPRDEAVGVLAAPRHVPGAAGASSEANGPCLRPSPTPEQEQGQGVTASDGGGGEAKGGGVVKVVWEGLRATEDCARGATGPELEAKVEEMVLEAIGDRLEANRPELPSWVKEDRGVVEVVWEGVGGTEGSDSEAAGEVDRGPQTAQTSPLRLQERLEGTASVEGEGGPRGSPDGFRQGGSGGEEGSFIWVERVTLSEEWEELLVEGLEGRRALGKEEGDESPLGVKRLGGAETWEAERRQAEESVDTLKKGNEEKAEEKGGAKWEGVETSLMVERKGREDPLEPERRGGEGKVETERKGVEEPLGVECKATEGPLRAEKERGEEKLREEEKEVEEPLVVEKKEEEKTGDEEPLDAEKKGNEESMTAERTGGEEPLQAEKTQEIKEDVNPEEQDKSGKGNECQAEEVSEAGAPLGAKEELRPEEEGPQKPQEKQEGSLEEEAVKPQTPAEGQDPSQDATPLLAETPAPEQPTECQPLLPVEGPRANPSARPVPTYAPAQQPEPSAPPEGEEASGPKQKTCQCCAVM
ncbi:paralemmin-3 isoform X1 [Molossus molossus]|uniref:paralemmin-3 isoform X1 n=1 Tax=Molossus molossus TaxID=27622 RepID=UPI001747C5BA|nr:paralemmin-3 isoform X1 [Molossus molossus]